MTHIPGLDPLTPAQRATSDATRVDISCRLGCGKTMLLVEGSRFACGECIEKRGEPEQRTGEGPPACNCNFASQGHQSDCPERGLVPRPGPCPHGITGGSHCSVCAAPRRERAPSLVTELTDEQRALAVSRLEAATKAMLDGANITIPTVEESKAAHFAPLRARTCSACGKPNAYLLSVPPITYGCCEGSPACEAKVRAFSDRAGPNASVSAAEAGTLIAKNERLSVEVSELRAALVRKTSKGEPAPTGDKCTLADRAPESAATSGLSSSPAWNPERREVYQFGYAQGAHEISEAIIDALKEEATHRAEHLDPRAVATIRRLAGQFTREAGK